MLKYLRKKQRHCGNENAKYCFSERGNGASPLQDMDSATSKPSGMTGTGAPVTEQLRCRVIGELGWYRDLFAPIVRGEFFVFIRR